MHLRYDDNVPIPAYVCAWRGAEMKGLKQQDELDTVKIMTGGIGYYTEHTAMYIITRTRTRKEKRAKKTNCGPRNRFRDGEGPYPARQGKTRYIFLLQLYRPVRDQRRHR